MSGKTLIPLCGVLFVAGASSCSTEQSTAIRYEVAVCDSVMDATHGHYYFITELYFPEKGVVCNANKADGGMSAFYSEIRNVSRIGVSSDAQKIVKPTEEIEVPHALAQEIFALAEETKSLEEISKRLGKRAVQLGILTSETKPLLGEIH